MTDQNDFDNVIELRVGTSVSQFGKTALQCAINAKLAMCALRGRGYVTATDAGEIVMIAKVLAQTTAVEGTTDLTAPQTMGSTTQTAASAAVERALADTITELEKTGTEG
jgi:hypothetical protein